MRLNKYLALSTGISRRAADDAIAQGRVRVNAAIPSAGHQVAAGDSVTLDGRTVKPPTSTKTIQLNKPVGYVCSRDGQGSRTVYDILPAELHMLKPVGRLDKDSSGLLLFTNDGALAQELTHPKYRKTKVYEIVVDKPLQPLHRQMISDHGISLEDGVSTFQIERPDDIPNGLTADTAWRVTMHEGRNRQIRRTFGALGYDVVRLHRTQFGAYSLKNLPLGKFEVV